MMSVAIDLFVHYITCIQNGFPTLTHNLYTQIDYQLSLNLRKYWMLEQIDMYLSEEIFLLILKDIEEQFSY